MTDLAGYLKGYIDAYWGAYDFFCRATPGDDYDNDKIVCQGCYENLTPEHECEGWGEGGSAGGAADAPTATPPLAHPGASRPLSAPARDGRASGSVPSSLPAIRQSALPDGVEIAGELEAMYVHRGMIQGIAMMAEAFRAGHMHAAETLCHKAVRGIEVEVEQR